MTDKEISPHKKGDPKNIIRIGIVGAGKGGNALLQILSDIPEVTIIGICDINPEAEGLSLAQEQSIPIYDNVKDLTANQEMDWLLNAAYDSLSEHHILAQQFHNISIIDGTIAKLIWRMIIEFNTLFMNKKEQLSLNKQQLLMFKDIVWNIIKEVVISAQAVSDELMDIAFHDALTGVYSRRVLMEFIHREVRHSLRNHHPLSLAMIDLDDFKKVNDTFGHSTGDDILKQVSLMLQRTARSSDIIARYGGEEFTVVIKNTDVVDAYVWGERIRKIIEDELYTPDGNPITISIGISSLSLIKNLDYDNKNNYSCEEIVEKLFTQADTALYDAKKSGKNRVNLFKENHK